MMGIDAGMSSVETGRDEHGYVAIVGEAGVGRFAGNRPESVRLPLDWVWPDGRREPVAQLLPQSGATREHDGFFYACLTKRQ